MFGFLTGAMATASQRFFSYNIGLNNEYKLKKVFSVTLTIYGLMALLIVVFAETIGFCGLSIQSLIFLSIECLLHDGYTNLVFYLLWYQS